MKKSLLVLAALFFLISYPLESQGLLNKVKKTVSKEISGVTGDDSSNNSSKPGPEPACACENAKLVMDLTKYTIAYEEITICTKDDGSMLVFDKLGSKYYISRDGKSEGPYNEGDPKITGFCSNAAESDGDEKADAWVTKYPDFISRSGEKYLIKFGGKNYGPYALINDFAVSKSKDKFAAIVTENMAVTEDQGKKMEEAMKNAKTDQERMDIAMKMSQQVQNQIMQGGGPGSIQPKLITNVQGANYDPITWMGGRLSGSVKFDDLLVIAPNKILDMKGITVLTLNQNSYSTTGLFVNSSNTKYASYVYGTLTFSDNTKLADLFNPYLIKTDGKVYLTYMYYSPGKNAIMQCAIPF
jgi:hypothetical protein